MDFHGNTETGFVFFPRFYSNEINERKYRSFSLFQKKYIYVKNASHPLRKDILQNSSNRHNF
jgi:hypothetical protein